MDGFPATRISRVSFWAALVAIAVTLTACGSQQAHDTVAWVVPAQIPVTTGTTSIPRGTALIPSAVPDSRRTSTKPATFKAPATFVPRAASTTVSPPTTSATSTTVVAASTPTKAAPRAAAPATAPAPCQMATNYIAAHGAPGWTTVCGYHAGYNVAGCVAAAQSLRGQVPYGCTDPRTLTTYIACPIFVVYANEAENQRYVSGLGGRFDAYGEAPQCAYANPLGR